MTAVQWFAASLVMAVLNERGGLWRRVTSVVLVQAADFDEAFEKACNRGYQQEQLYENADGERVRWAFERVATLDILPENLSDGIEVYSEPGEVLNDSTVRFDVQFIPKLGEPGQTGISPT